MGRAAGRKQNVPRQPVPGTPEGEDIGLSALQDPAGSPIPGLTGNIVNYESVRRTPPVADETFDEYRGIMAHGVPNDSQTTEERATMVREGTLAQHNPPSAPDLSKPRQKPPAIPVYIVDTGGGSSPITTMAGQKVSIPANGSAAARIAGRDESRSQLYILVETTSVSVTLTPPAVPATTVPAQNPNAFPVTVVIGANGATITAVTVNGIVVGSAAGTYTVPPYGSISITYTVATPTWTWTGTSAPAGIRISHEVADLDVGFGALIKPGVYQKFDGFQDELFAVSADSNTQIVSMIFLFEVAAGA